MNLKKLVICAGLIAGLVGSVSAASSNHWDQWMNDYYKSPSTDKVVQSAFGIGHADYLDRPGATATVIGFYSQIFAANPDKVDAWFSRFQSLPIEGRRAMAAALWYSGDPRGERELRKVADGSEVEADIKRLIAYSATPVSETPVLSESSMNLQWGAFLANGSAAHVNQILAAIGRGDVGDSARVSLAFNAANHDRVLNIVRDELNRQPNDVRSMLRAVINDAETKAQPTS